MPYHNFGGVMTMIRGGSIGKLGGNYAYQNIKGAWDSGISIAST